MFRALVKDRHNLSGDYVADLAILSADIDEDTLQNTVSKIIVKDLDTEKVKIDDILGIYDSYGSFYYWGVITAISEKQETNDATPLVDLRQITLSQFESIYNDKHLILAQTSTNQKSFFNTKSVGEVIDMFLFSKECGYESIKNTMSTQLVPVFSGIRDADIMSMFKGLTHSVFDNDTETHVPFPLDKETLNLTDWLYNMADSYNRLLRPFVASVSLPDPYVPCEYIESTGEQYIDTGLVPGEADNLNKLRIEIDAAFIDISETAGLVSSGYYNSTAGNRRNIVARVNDSEFKLLNGAQLSTATSIGPADTDRHRFVIDQEKRLYSVNNLNYGSSSSVSNALVKPLILFAEYNSNTSGSPIANYSKVKLYGAKIFRSSVLIAWYIPCYNKLTKEIGLYDKVSDQFIGNSGTGVFLKGVKRSSALEIAIINPDGYFSYDSEHYWDYRKKILFDSWEYIKNPQVTEEDVEVNTVCIYNSDGSTLRGSYTLLNNGDVQEIADNTPIPNRMGVGKTEYVFDTTNSINDIVKSKLGNNKYNHEITFTLYFNDTYGFKDLNIGQKVDFYKGNKKYESIITGRKYGISAGADKVLAAEYTLGKVRTKLTSKININKIKKQKK